VERHRKRPHSALNNLWKSIVWNARGFIHHRNGVRAAMPVDMRYYEVLVRPSRTVRCRAMPFAPQVRSLPVDGEER